MITTSHPATNERKGEKGFTLVELMVVVAIIALLAAIVIPNYVHARAQAAVSQSEANIKQIATALELYYADQQTYPNGTGNVAPGLFNVGAATTNPYMTTTPTNALGRENYMYTFIAAAGGTPAKYTLLDPGPYDPSTLASLPNGGSAGNLCGPASCTKINYSPQDGIYGT